MHKVAIPLNHLGKGILKRQNTYYIGTSISKKKTLIILTQIY